jgi:hypothetical protein
MVLSAVPIYGRIGRCRWCAYSSQEPIDDHGLGIQDISSIGYAVATSIFVVALKTSSLASKSSHQKFLQKFAVTISPNSCGDTDVAELTTILAGFADDVTTSANPR